MQHYRRVSYENRCQISVLKDIGISIREISTRLSLHRSTVYREIKRNLDAQGRYKASTAHRYYLKRRQRCSPKRIFEDPVLVYELEKVLKRGWSPEVISGRFGWSSHQTIYNEIRKHRKDLRKLLYTYDRRPGRPRKHRLPLKEKPSWLRSISDRSKVVANRSRLGDWERDTIMVKDREMILVCLERRSRYIRLSKINMRSYKKVASQCKRLMKVGKQVPLTITNDNGTEFMDGYKFKIPVFYCDPYTPQQRGSVENIIRRLRDDLTRQTPIESITRSTLRALENRFNHRPRKILGYRTPHEVIHKMRVALGS